VTLGDLAKYPMTWSVARSLSDSWASCLRNLAHDANTQQNCGTDFRNFDFKIFGEFFL